MNIKDLMVEAINDHPSAAICIVMALIASIGLAGLTGTIWVGFLAFGLLTIAILTIVSM